MTLESERVHEWKYEWKYEENECTMTLLNNSLYNMLDCYATNPTVFEQFILPFDS